MEANILLNAILNTKDIETKIKALKSQVNQGGDHHAGIGFFGKNMAKKSIDDLRLLKHHLRAFESDAIRLKNAGIFGDTTRMKILNKEFESMFGERASSNIGRFHKQILKLDQTWKNLEIDALKGRGKGFRKVWEQEGTQGLMMRQALGTEWGFRGKGVPKKGAQTFAQSMAKLMDLEPLKQKSELLRKEFTHLENKAFQVSKTIKGGFKPLTNMFNNLGVAGTSLASVFGTLAAKVATWLIATTGLFMAIAAIRGLGREMKALQDQEIALRRVMDGTAQEVDHRIKQSYAFAKSMNILAGATYKDTLTALQNVTKAGFAYSDSLAITRAALLGVNVAEMTAEQGSRYLIATIRQFNLSASASLWIMDQWNELGKKTGATSVELAEAVIRSGKAFQAVGGSLSQLNAIAAATIEATGESGEKIGTMLKTVSARFADLDRKKSLESLLKAENIDIDIYDEVTGKFNNIFEVMQKLSGAWETLDGRQQSNIGKAAAGVRQWSRFLGVVENFDGVMKALVDTLNSNNSALDENAKRVDSLDFSLRRLSGASSTLASSRGARAALAVTANVIYTLTFAFNSLIHPIGIVTVLLGGATIAYIKLAAAVKAATVIVAGKITALKTMMTILSPILWKVAIIGGIIALAFGGGHILKAAAETERLKEAMYDTFKASYKVNEEFKENIEIMARYYQGLDKTTEKGKLAAANIDKLFESKLGKSLSESLATASKEGRTFNSVLEEMKKKAEDLNSVVTLIDKLAQGLIDINEDLNFFDRGVKFLSTGNTVNESIENIKKLRDALKALGRDIPLSQFVDKMELMEETIIKGLGIDSIKDAKEEFNKLINMQKGITLPKAVKYALLGPLYPIGEPSKADIEKAKNTIQTLQENLSKMLGVEIDLTNVENFEHIIDMIVNFGKHTKEEAEELLKGLVRNEIQDQEEKHRRLLGMVERYYDEEYQIASQTYEKIKKLNESMVSGFTKGLFDLSEGVEFGKRFENAFSGMGEAIWGQLMDDINVSISDALTGNAPKSMAQQIKDAIAVGGDVVEDKIVAGFANAVGGMDAAIDLWSNKLMMAVHGQDVDSNLKSIMSKFGTDLGGFKKVQYGNLGGDVNVRPSAGTGLDPLDTLKKGNVVKVLEKMENGWAKVAYGEKFDKEGYINLNAVGLTGAINRLEVINRDLVNSNYKLGNKLLEATEKISEFIKDKVMGIGESLGFSNEAMSGMFEGMGVGAYVAGSGGRNAAAGGMYGGIGSLLASSMEWGPWGMLAGAVLGGLLAPKDPEPESDPREQENYAKQSTKELQYINRNTSAMVEELRNFSLMQDSHYFSFNNSMARA